MDQKWAWMQPGTAVGNGEYRRLGCCTVVDANIWVSIPRRPGSAITDTADGDAYVRLRCKCGYVWDVPSDKLVPFSTNDCDLPFCRVANVRRQNEAILRVQQQNKIHKRIGRPLEPIPQFNTWEEAIDDSLNVDPVAETITPVSAVELEYQQPESGPKTEPELEVESEYIETEPMVTRTKVRSGRPKIRTENHQVVNMKMVREALEWIELERGYIPRSTFVRRLLDKEAEAIDKRVPGYAYYDEEKLLLTISLPLRLLNRLNLRQQELHVTRGELVLNILSGKEPRV